MKLNLILEEGDIICSKCKGKGGQMDNRICSKCKGSGKLDWIEQLVGKKDPYNLGIKKLKHEIWTYNNEIK